MPPPSPLHIATQAVQRLLKEETYYEKELAQQESRVKKLEEEIEAGQRTEDENAEYVLKQEKKAVEETKAVFGPLRQRIDGAMDKLEEQIAIAESEGGSGDELAKAKETLEKGRAVSN